MFVTRLRNDLLAEACQQMQVVNIKNKFRGIKFVFRSPLRNDDFQDFKILKVEWKRYSNQLMSLCQRIRRPPLIRLY